MVRLAEVIGPLLLALEIFCFIDVLMTKEEDARHLGKWIWLVLVLLFPLVGCVAWLAVGRPPRHARGSATSSAFPEYDRPGRATGATPESDAQFLARVRARAEEQRRRGAEQRRRVEPEEP